MAGDRKPIGWRQCDGWIEATDIPPWNDALHPPNWTIAIYIEPRPAYCDRGRYIVKVDAPIDAQDGFPRYYFDLDVAKREMQAWVDARAELKPHGERRQTPHMTRPPRK